MKSKTRWMLAAALVFLTLPSLLVGQTATGRINGVIRDESDAVVPGATITVTHKSTGLSRQVISDENGSYATGSLPPGEYEVKVELTGFQQMIQSTTLLVGSSNAADFKLKVGAANQVIQVVGDTPMINLTDFKIDGVVDRQQIENLPLNGRNFLQLAMLEPGVEVTSVANPGTSPNNFFRVSIAGAGQALTRISVDGATINDRVTGGTAQNFSQETVEEFQISTFNFDLSTSVTGVGSVNVVSRTGTNEFHGSAFIYFRDNNMAGFPDFRRPCDPTRRLSGCNDPSTRSALENPFFARRQMGFAAGGPVKKDSVFWFVNYEHNNQDGVFPINNNHPIFTQFDNIAPNPLNAKQGNARIDWKVTNKHTAFLRLSTDVNDNFNPNDGIRMPSNWVVSENVANQAALSLTSVFTPRIVNDFRYSYGFYSNHLNNPTASDCRNPIYCFGMGGPQVRTTDSGFRFGNNTQTPQNRVLRTYQMTDTFSWQKGTHRVRFGGEWEHFYGQGHWAFVDPAIITLWGPLHLAQFAAAVPALFGPLYASLPDSLKLNATGTAPLRPGLLPTVADIYRLPMANITMGVGDPGQPPPFRRDEASRNDRLRFYFHDAWRVKPHFTLNYGFAYIYENRLLNHDLDRPALLSPLLAGNLNPPRLDKNNFDPSLGFAWDVMKNGKTVIRGGAGIYHDSNVFWTRLQERALTGPSGNGRTFLDGSLVPFPGSSTGVLNFVSNPTDFRGAQVLPLIPGLVANLTGLLGSPSDLSVRGVELFKQGERIFDPDTTIGYSINTSFGIQREIARNLVLTADFVMRRSVHFGGLHDVFLYDRNRFDRPASNTVNPTTGRGTTQRNPVIPRCSGAQAFNPKALCSNGAIRVSESSANFRYTGLHLKVEKRFSDRYQFTGSYALSRYTGFNGVINFDNFFEANGYQGADRLHRFTFSGILDVPRYNGNVQFLRGLLNTWQVSLISQMVSTPPLNTVIGGVDIDGDGNSTMILPGAEFNSFGRQVGETQLRNLVDQFNQKFPTAVTGKRTPFDQVIPTLVLPSTFSNGDSFYSQDVRVTRIIRLGERYKLTLIGEVFNLFNISNLGGYSGSLNGANYGQPSNRVGQVFGTGGPRAFQIAARFVW